MYPDANTPRGRKIADFMQLFDELVRVELLSYGPMVYPEFTVDMKAPQFYNKRAAGSCVLGRRVCVVWEQCTVRPGRCTVCRPGQITCVVRGIRVSFLRFPKQLKSF